MFFVSFNLFQTDRLFCSHRRTSSVGIQLFQERGVSKQAGTMMALMEDDEEDDSDDQEKSEDQNKSVPPKGGKDKPAAETEDKSSADIKDTADPLAALGDKLAKLRYK